MLFDAIAAQKKYNEEAIKRRFKGHGFVQRLPEAKRELILVILRAMRQFHAHRNPLRRTLSAYTDGLFLGTRGLSRLAAKLMQEAVENSKLTANHALRSLSAYGISSVERSEDVFPEPTSPIESDFSVIEAELNLEAARMEALTDRMQALVYRYGQSRSIVAQAIARDLIKAGSALQPVRTLASQNAWLRMQSLQAFFFDNDFPRSLELDKERLHVLESNESYRRANLFAWLNLNHSLALRFTLVGDLRNASPLRDTLRHYWLHESRTSAPSNRRTVSGQYLNIELFLAVNQMDVDGIVPVLPTLKKLLDEHEEDSPTEIGIAANFNIAIIEFARQRYRDVIRQLNRIDDYPAAMRADIHRASIYLRIICHIELEHDSVVTSLVRKQRREMKGAEVSRDEDVLLSLCSSFLNSTPGRQRTALVKNALDQIEEMSVSGITMSTTSMFGFKEWLRSKLERRTWRELIAEPAQK